MTSSTSPIPRPASRPSTRASTRAPSRPRSARCSGARRRPHAAALGPVGREGGGLQGGAAARSGRALPSLRARRGGRRRAPRRAPLPVPRRARRAARSTPSRCPRRPRREPSAPASRRCAAKPRPGAPRAALALRAAARLLGAAAEELEIVREGRCPRLLRRGGPSGLALSLSHHGRFAAFALAPGRGARLSALRPIRCLGVANRGEAAMRCIRTVKALRAREGAALEVVALYTDADRDAPFVRHADRALPARAGGEPGRGLPRPRGPRRRRSASRAPTRSGRAGASSPRIPRSPSAATPRASASSARRRRRCAPSATRSTPSASPRRTGVPVLPWSGGEVLDDAHARARGRGDRLPAAREGVGGRRRPRHPHRRTRPRSCPGRCARRRAEALAAFGDARVFLEAAVRGGRHVEVQIVADEHGTRARPRLPRLLGPAPTPEGDRGGAAPGALARLPRGPRGGRAAPRRRRRLPGRRHRRVPRGGRAPTTSSR